MRETKITYSLEVCAARSTPGGKPVPSGQWHTVECFDSHILAYGALNKRLTEGDEERFYRLQKKTTISTSTVETIEGPWSAQSAESVNG